MPKGVDAYEIDTSAVFSVERQIEILDGKIAELQRRRAGLAAAIDSSQTTEGHHPRYAENEYRPW